MMYRRLSLFLLLFASVAASCQSVTGTLLGTVADASGVVPGVKVTATNQGTNVTLSTVTNQVGDYEFDNLSSGLYRIHVERQGFRSVDVKNVQLLPKEQAKATADNTATLSGSPHDDGVPALPEASPRGDVALAGYLNSTETAPAAR